MKKAPAVKPLKRLFNPDDTYGPEATKLAKQVQKALQPIIDKMQVNGYSMKDVQYVLKGEADWMCCLAALHMRAK